jgi:hypothetical protein
MAPEWVFRPKTILHFPAEPGERSEYIRPPRFPLSTFLIDPCSNDIAV